MSNPNEIPLITDEEMAALVEVLADPIPDENDDIDFSDEYEPTAEDLAEMEDWLDSRSDIRDFLEN